MKEETFRLTEDHLKLLSKAYVGWWDADPGAPCIECTRPYGNRALTEDVVAILGWPTVDTEDGPALPPGTIAKAKEIHRETRVALQVVLANIGSVRPGLYRIEVPHDQRSWRRIGD